MKIREKNGFWLKTKLANVITVSSAVWAWMPSALIGQKSLSDHRRPLPCRLSPDARLQAPGKVRADASGKGGHDSWVSGHEAGGSRAAREHFEELFLPLFYKTLQTSTWL